MGKPQTVAYAEETPCAGAYLFVTLGIGEFFAKPKGERFRWIRIRNFLAALETIQTQDLVIDKWRDAIRHEIERQDMVKCGDQRRIAEYRSGTWNIYLLGLLKEAIEYSLKGTSEGKLIDCTCYPYGQAPDTILNFGWANGTEYMEITKSGHLRLKKNFEEFKDEKSKRDALASVIEYVGKNYCSESFRCTPKPNGKIGKTKTVALFDVGLVNRDGHLEYEVSQNETRERVLKILKVFHKSES